MHLDALFFSSYFTASLLLPFKATPRPPHSSLSPWEVWRWLKHTCSAERASAARTRPQTRDCAKSASRYTARPALLREGCVSDVLHVLTALAECLPARWQLSCVWLSTAAHMHKLIITLSFGPYSLIPTSDVSLLKISFLWGGYWKG